MDVFELIEAAHRKVETIFSEIEKTNGSKKLDQYFNQLYKELNVHAQTEELTLYPAMRDHSVAQFHSNHMHILLDYLYLLHLHTQFD